MIEKQHLRIKSVLILIKINENWAFVKTKARSSVPSRYPCNINNKYTIQDFILYYIVIARVNYDFKEFYQNFAHLFLETIMVARYGYLIERILNDSFTGAE